MLFIVFIYGLLIGSFLNVCIYRIPRHESIVFTSSHCVSCGTPIKYYDLIPVLSYVLLGGKCRFCKCAISPQYPLVELAAATLMTLQAWKWGLGITSGLYAVLTAALIVVTVIDFYHQIIPDSLIIVIAILGIAALFAVQIPQFGFAAVIDSTIGFLVAGTLFLFISLVSKGGMGGGDIKLMAVLGLWFGWKQILLSILVAFVAGAVISILLLLMHEKGVKDGIPFGPFIALSAYLISLFGNEILQWYCHFIMLL